MTLMALSLSIGAADRRCDRGDREHLPPHGARRDARSRPRPAATEEIGLAVIASAAATARRVRSDRVHARRRRTLLPRVRHRRHLHRLHVGAGGADARPRCSARATCGRRRSTAASTGCSSRSIVRSRAHYRRVLAWGLRHRPATLAIGFAGRGRRHRGGARGAGRLHHPGGPQRVQRLAQAAARQHRPRHPGGDDGRRRRAAPQPGGRGRLLDHRRRRHPARQRGASSSWSSCPRASARRPSRSSWPRCAAASASSDSRSSDFAVEEIGFFSVAGSRNAQIMYSIRGPDIDRLQFFARSLVTRMREAGGYADLMLSYETGKPEIALEITRERAADLGVPALQIGRTISALFAGYKATTFEEGGERYDVRVQVLPEYRDDPAKLALVHVRAPSGALVPLRNLVNAARRQRPGADRAREPHALHHAARQPRRQGGGRRRRRDHGLREGARHRRRVRVRGRRAPPSGCASRSPRSASPSCSRWSRST